MKLQYILLFLFISLKFYAAPPRYQYCVSYCVREDTLFDSVHHPILNQGLVTMFCASHVFELHNGDCPAELHYGLNTSLSPSKCYRLKNYNSQQYLGDGENDYKDPDGISWTSKRMPHSADNENIKAFISYSKKLEEFCLEIPLLKYKIVLFNLDNYPAKDGYTLRMKFEGNSFVLELAPETLKGDTLKPALIKYVYDFKYLLDERRDELIVTNPNPFDQTIRVTLSKAVVDSNVNLKLVLKDLNGKILAEQHVEGIVTTINTVMIPRGKYLLILARQEDMLDYKQMFK